MVEELFNLRAAHMAFLNDIVEQRVQLTFALAVVSCRR